MIADAEVLERAVRQRAPELVGGNSYSPQGIYLDPCVRLAHDALYI